MSSTTVNVRLGARSYDILITTDDPSGVGSFARQRSRGKLAFLVTDENVSSHAAHVASALMSAGFQTSAEVLPAGEGQKTLAVASRLYDRLIDLHADRRTLVVAVGGGVIGDLAGFAASTWARGVQLLMVPTTLLAMVDSSVGGKVGVNHPRAKNMIGTFHQPAGVWIDTAALATLPEREYRSGLGEVIKYGVILDAELFAYLETHADAVLAREAAVVRHIVAHCCRLKADVVEKDEREETGQRVALNYGHTFAHAFEAAAGYGSCLHGEAVAMGMLCASRLAELHGLISADVSQRQRTLIQRFQLPTAPQAWPVDALLATMRSDKKAVAGRLRFVLPRRLGEVALFDDVPEMLVRQTLEEAAGS